MRLTPVSTATTNPTWSNSFLTHSTKFTGQSAEAPVIATADGLLESLEMATSGPTHLGQRWYNSPGLPGFIHWGSN